MRFPVIANTDTVMSSSATRYNSVTIQSSGVPWVSTIDETVTCLIPFRCSISQLVVELATTAPGSGKSFAFTIVKNGSDTALTCTVSGTSFEASDTTHSVIFEAGDTICIKSVPSGTPSAPSNIRFSFIVDTLGRPEYFYFKTYGAPNATSRYFSSVQHSGRGYTSHISFFHNKSVFAQDATVTQMLIGLKTAPGVGKSFVFSLYKNTTEEASSQVTISGTDKTGSVTGLSIPFTVGDDLALSSLPSGTPAVDHVQTTVVVRPKVDGEYSSTSVSTNLGNTGTQWNRAFCSVCVTNTDADDTKVKNICPPNITMYLLGFYIKVSVAPGAGKSYAFTMRKNGVDTAVTFTLSDANKTASDTTHQLNIESTDKISIKSVPASTPANTSGAAFYSKIFIPPATMRGNQ